jgi:hypothetical protein
LVEVAIIIGQFRLRRNATEYGAKKSYRMDSTIKWRGANLKVDMIFFLFLDGET